jgi:hypothetical protein
LAPAVWHRQLGIGNEAREVQPYQERHKEREEAHRAVTWEARLVIIGSLALVVVATSAPLAFRYNRPEWWLVVKLTTEKAAACAAALIVINIFILPG